MGRVKGDFGETVGKKKSSRGPLLRKNGICDCNVRETQETSLKFGLGKANDLYPASVRSKKLAGGNSVCSRSVTAGRQDMILKNKGGGGVIILKTKCNSARKITRSRTLKGKEGKNAPCSGQG